MPTSIDSLQIEISAKASKANQSIDTLVWKLGRLNASLGRLNTTNLVGLANGVDKLGRAMQTMNTVKTADFTRLATNLAKLGNINVSALNSTASSLSHLTRAFNSFSGVSFDNKNLQNMINSITRLSNSNVQSLASVDFSRLGISINQLATSLSNAPKIQQSVISMTNAIANLSKSGQNIPIVASSLGSLGQSMNAFMASVSSAPNVSGNVISFAQAVGLLANSGKNAGVTAKNLSSLGVGLRNLMATLSKAPLVSQNVIQMTNALARLSAQGNRISTATNAMNTGIRSTYTPMRRARVHTFNLASAIGMLYAKYFLVLRGIRLFSKALTSTADYIEAYNYMNVALGKIGADWSHQYEEYGYESADTYADSFSYRLQEKIKKMSGLSIEVDAEGKGLLTETGMKNLGLNIKEVTQYASQLAAVTNSVGQTGEVSLATSSALTKLGADMSSLYNLDYSQVMGNLQSGLAGQSRALYKYGIDITQTTLQQKAFDLGITKSVSEMSQMEKQQLRIISILEQSRVAWGDLANTIDSPSNMIRVFKNNLAETGMVLGQLFTPALQGILPILNGVTIAIKRLLVNMAGLMGIKLDFQDYGEGFTETEDVFDNLTEGTEDATEALKEYKNQALDFDEINPLKDMNTSTGNSSIGGGAIDLTDEIIASTEAYEKVWEEAYNKMESKSQNIADRIVNAFKKAFEKNGWFGVGDLISSSIADSLANADWDMVHEGLEDVAENTADFLNGLITPDLLGEVGTSFAKSLNAVINAKATLGEEIDFEQVGEAIATGINNFFDTFDFERLGESINTWVQGLADALIEAIKEIEWSDVISGFSDLVMELDTDTIAVLLSLGILRRGGLGGLGGTGSAGGLGLGGLLFGTGAGAGLSGLTIGNAGILGTLALGAGAGTIGTEIGRVLGYLVTGDADLYLNYNVKDATLYIANALMEDAGEVKDAANKMMSDLTGGVSDWLYDTFDTDVTFSWKNILTGGITGFTLMDAYEIIDTAINGNDYGGERGSSGGKIMFAEETTVGINEDALDKIDDWDAFIKSVNQEYAATIEVQWLLGGRNVDFLGIGEEMKKQGASIAWNIGQGILNDKSAKSAISILASSMKSVLGDRSDSIVSFAKSFGGSIVASLSLGLNQNSTVKSAVGNITSAITTAFGNKAITDTATSKGKSIIWNLGQGLLGGKQMAITPLQTIINSLKNVLSSNDMYNAFKSAGGFILDGLIAGLKDNKKTSTLAKTVESIGGVVSSAFTTYMDINSPSGLFMQYGKYTVDGFNLGIQKYAPNTSDIMTDWSNSIAGADMTYNNTTTVSRDEEIMLLRQQNMLLQELLNKDTNVEIKADSKGLFKTIQKQANDYTIQTGQPAFAL